MIKAFITLTFTYDQPLKINPLAIESFYKHSTGDTILTCSTNTYRIKETLYEIEAMVDEWMKHQVGTIT